MSRVNMRLVRFLFSICVLASAFFYAPDVEADSLASDYISERVDIELFDYDGSHYRSFSWDNLKQSLPTLLPEDSYYRINYHISGNLSFYNYIDSLETLTLTLDIEDENGEVNYSYVLYHLDHVEFPSSYDVPFLFSGSFIMPGNYYSLGSMYSDLSFSFSNADTYRDAMTYAFNCTLTVDSVEKLSVSDQEIYQRGFDEGYDEGLFNGFLVGQTSGFNTGYNSGYSSGFEAGADSVDQDSIFDSGFDLGFDLGFESGADSVDTDQFYEQGYDSGFADGLLAGSGSVDQEALFDAGYRDGHNVGYSSGYDDGYSKGYSEALESLDVSNSTTLEAGTSKTYSFSQTVEESLSFKSANTPFSNLVYDSGGIGESFSIVDLEGYWYDDGDLSYGGSIESDFEYQPYFRGYSYNMSSIKSLFKASPDVYAYKIILKPVNVALETDSVYWLRTMFGTYSDVLACSGEYGHLIVDGSTQNSSVWLVTDYSDIYICLGYLSYFQHSYHGNASYSLDWNFNIEVIPYTKNEYNAAVPAIEKQTLELQKQTEAMKQEMNDLKNGYDSSSADKMNDDFSASLTDYQTTEDSLFNSAKGGLDSFNFVDFASYPSLVTSMSFTTSLMTAVYNAMGGNSGPFGIVLSILFSVMLVAMVIGLSRFFKSDGKGDD